MRVERDRCGRETRREGRLDHASVSEVDAVEGADRHRSFALLELADRASHLHGRTVPFTATSSPSHTTRARSVTRVRPARTAAASLRETSTWGRNGNASAGERILASSASSMEKWTAFGAPERRAMASELAGHSAHVGPRADQQIQRRDALLVARQSELVDGRASNRHLHGHAAAGQPVRALSVGSSPPRPREPEAPLRPAQRVEPQPPAQREEGASRAASSRSPSGSPVVVRPERFTVVT